MHPREAISRLNDQIPQYRHEEFIGANWILYFTGLNIENVNVLGFWIAAKRSTDETNIERHSVCVHSVFGRMIYPEDLLTTDGFNEIKHKVLDARDKLITAIQKEG